MKHVVTILLLFMVFVSCEKPITSDSGSDDSQGVKADDNLVVSVPVDGLSFTRLNFAVYDMTGTRVKQVNQQMDLSRTASFQLAPLRRSTADFGKASFQLAPLRRSTALFGTASFQLASGNYALVVVAHSSDGNPTMTDPKKIQFKNAQGFTETFLYYDHVTIGDERVNLWATPKRIVALCRFVLTDDYPTGVAKMRFYYTGGSGAFDATTGLGCVNSKQSLSFDVTSGQKQFDLYTFLHDTEGTIHLTVTALDVSDVEFLHRDFDVPLVQNKITWVSGSFFSNSMTISTVSINADWDGEYHLTF